MSITSKLLIFTLALHECAHARFQMGNDWDFSHIHNQHRQHFNQFDSLMGDLSSRLAQQNSMFGSMQQSLGSSNDWALGQLTSLFGNGNQMMSWKPWWQGENVCERRELSGSMPESNERREDTGSVRHNSNTQTFGQFTSSYCEDDVESYVCTVTSSSNGQVRRVKTIYECCLGWTRDPLDTEGCTQPLDLEKLVPTLENNNLTKLAEALNQFGVSEKLNDANFTVFAPNNQAFEAVGVDWVNTDMTAVLLDDQESFVKDLLASHVVEGWSRVRDWTDEEKLTTLSDGATIRVNKFAGGLQTANCVPIVGPELRSSNGVVHVLDKVMPPVKQTIWGIVGQDPRFSVFADLVDSELQQKLLDENQHLTLLVFTNEAFERLPQDIQTQIREKQDVWRMLRRTC
jgi:uncharacterized surface protein with fasciclin (FAS1) repeats